MANPKSYKDGEYFHPLAWLLARYAFLMTHVAFFYLVFFATNDPLGLGFINTIDSTVPKDSCQTFDIDAFKFDLLLYVSVWWFPHSTLARDRVKTALGLKNHPLDRPIFAFIASTTWALTVHFWKPIDTCTSFDITKLSLPAVVGSLLVAGVASFFILSLLYILPNHVFGTSCYKFPPGHYDAHENILVDYPYGLSRHPAAAGFFWIYGLFQILYFLGYATINHVVLAVFWQVFILVGTLVFEEGGLEQNKDDFSIQYVEYRARTGFLWPTLYSMKRCLSLKVKPYSWEKAQKAQ